MGGRRVSQVDIWGSILPSKGKVGAKVEGGSMADRAKENNREVRATGVERGRGRKGES